MILDRSKVFWSGFTIIKLLGRKMTHSKYLNVGS